MRTGVYREDGGAHRVEILSDTVDEQGRRTVRLRCIESLAPQRTPWGPVRIAPGEEFEVSHRGGSAYSGMWTLFVDAPDPAEDVAPA